MEKTGIELLTELQSELGYVPGPISTVAILGLVGEAGEVLAETHISLFNDRMVHTACQAIRACAEADKLKKDIRKGKAAGTITLESDQQLAFDTELADTFYYIKALAANRGLTIDDLARISHDKVRAKMESGKSSEQYQQPKISDIINFPDTHHPSYGGIMGLGVSKPADETKIDYTLSLASLRAIEEEKANVPRETFPDILGLGDTDLNVPRETEE